MSALLKVENLAVHYGGIVAVEQLSFELNAGECVALIGANGAGKSSTLKALVGLVEPAAGQITFAQQPLNPVPVWERAARGVCLVPEGRGVFTGLTIQENLEMGAFHRKAVAASELDQVYELFPRLFERRTQLAGTLSGGEQQMLAMGRALMAKPRLLMLDEPSMGLAPLMVEKIFEVIESIANSGVTLLLVEQNARLALSVCQRALVMESGRLVLSDSAANCLNNSQVRAAYLGE
jgi:branched-chain amino acid transport system ATP-binding protein